MRTLNSKIPGKAGRKRCVNVSRSVSVCQSDPLALPKPPGRDRQAGCFLESGFLTLLVGPSSKDMYINSQRLEHGLTELNSLYQMSKTLNVPTRLNTNNDVQLW